ncbi:hypothetical protein SR39_02170 [Methylobacterium radiotolerans]|nr:hypothetical protein SR39_02170 [Methylobacterium radiotolerans]
MQFFHELRDILASHLAIAVDRPLSLVDRYDLDSTLTGEMHDPVPEVFSLTTLVERVTQSFKKFTRDLLRRRLSRHLDRQDGDPIANCDPRWRLDLDRIFLARVCGFEHLQCGGFTCAWSAGDTEIVCLALATMGIDEVIHLIDNAHEGGMFDELLIEFPNEIPSLVWASIAYKHVHLSAA